MSADDTQRSFEELAAMLRHELATPVAVIEAVLEELSGDDRIPHELRDQLDAARRQTDVIHGLLVELETAWDDELSLELERVDLAWLARTTVDDLSSTVLARHPHRVQDEADVVVRGDPGRLRQLLTNLLDNAAAYSSAGQEITVRVRREDDEVALEVRDRGSGVAPEDRERIFEPYVRAHEDTEGLGLGLHVCRRIAQAHDGRIGTEPAPDGQGSIFRVVLPAA